MQSEAYDPLDPRVVEDPYPFYAELRRSAPVHFVPTRGFFVVSRYADVLGVLRRPELFSSAAMAAAVTRPRQFAPEGGDGSWVDEEGVSIVGTDGARHARLRQVVNRGFTPGRIAALAPRIRTIAAELAAPLLAGGDCEFVGGFAVPLPVRVIAEMLDVDAERLGDFKRWADAAMAGVFEPLGEQEGRSVGAALAEMGDYFDGVIAERRRRPRRDLVSELVQAEEEQGTLTPTEVKTFVFTLLVAGSVTTTHLVSNALLALLSHPTAWEELSSDASFIPGFVEEALRYVAPLQLTFRTAVEEVELAGTRVPAGATVAPLLGSANRDEAAFPEPDRFDVHRHPKDHLGFGHGVHFCLGAALARLEARIAFETLLARMRRPELAEDRVPWLQSMVFRGPARLRLRSAGG